MTYGALKSKIDLRDNRLAVAGAADFPSSFEINWLPTIKNQRSINSCHDDQTEVLTRNGWKLFKDITYQDELASANPQNGDLIFEHPTDILCYEYNGPMIVGKHQSLDFKVTPNHKMVVRKSYKSKLEQDYSFLEARSLTYWAGFRTDFHYHSDISTSIILEEEKVSNGNLLPRLEIPLELWVQLLGIYLAEGTLYKDGPKYHYRIQLAAVKDREKTYIRKLLKDIGINGINEQKDRFHFSNKRIWKKFDEYGLVGVKSYDKFVPNFVFSLDEKYIKLFLLGFAMGDECFSDKGTVNLFTTSKVLAEQLQILRIMSGSYGIIIEKSPEAINKNKKPLKDGREITAKHTQYIVTEWKRKELSITRRKNITIENYNGYVYCATVPTYHTLLTRRNKYILLSGNCVAHATSSILEYFEKAEHDDETTLSTDFIYGMQDRTGKGMYLRDACKIVQKYGDTLKKTFPGNTEQPTCGEKVKAKLEEDKEAILEEADWYKIKTYVNCKTTAEKKTALYTERPLLGSIKWYDNYTLKDGVITFDTSSDYGYHAIMVYGWNEKGWLCQNSWGSTWGNKGRFILPYSSGLEEAWAFTDAERTTEKSPTTNFFFKLLNYIINFFLGR